MNNAKKYREKRKVKSEKNETKSLYRITVKMFL